MDGKITEQDERAFEEWYKNTFTARTRAAVERNDNFGQIFFKTDVRCAYFAGKKDASNG